MFTGIIQAIGKISHARAARRRRASACTPASSTWLTSSLVTALPWSGVCLTVIELPEGFRRRRFRRDARAHHARRLETRCRGES